MAKTTRKNKPARASKSKQDTSPNKEIISIVGDGNVVGNHSSSHVTKIASRPTPTPLASPAPANSRNRQPLWIVTAGGITSAILAITTNVIAAYLQETFGILNDITRFAAVVVVFLVSLGITIWLGIRHHQPAH